MDELLNFKCGCGSMTALPPIVNPKMPELERQTFSRFVEESGTNAILLEAIGTLYQEAEMPSDPIEWFKIYFRKLAPARTATLKETKAALKRDLMELETSILLMKEDEIRKTKRLNQLRNTPYPTTSSVNLPNPDQYHKDENEQLRVDTRWLISPDPFFKTTCLDEGLKLKKKLEDSLSFMHPEDGFEDFRKASTERGGETEEEYETEDWLQAYKSYKETSELRKSSLLPEPTAPATATGEEEEIDEHEDELCPDVLPPNYWVPGFTLHPIGCLEERSDIEVASRDKLLASSGNNYYYEGYYKSSVDGKYRQRPRRSQIIYENEWSRLQCELNIPEEIVQDQEEEAYDEDELLSAPPNGPVNSGYPIRRSMLRFPDLPNIHDSRSNLDSEASESRRSLLHSLPNCQANAPF